jgi:4-carboxymuconolactone decarboxylase
MKKVIYLTTVLAVAMFNAAITQETIFPKGEKASNVHHTGDVWLTHVSHLMKHSGEYVLY